MRHRVRKEAFAAQPALLKSKMQKLDVTRATVQADGKLLHLEIVVPLRPDECSDFQRALEAVLRLYERLKAERIRSSH